MEDHAGFSAFVDARSNSLLRAAWLLTGDWPNAEDLVQTALTKAWLRWERAVSEGTPEAYVRQIMMSVFLGWRRRRWLGATPRETLPELDTGDVFASIDGRRSVLAALEVLSPRQRAAIVLRYFADLSEADTAAAMNCSPGSVKSHIARALNRLRNVPGLDQVLAEGIAL